MAIDDPDIQKITNEKLSREVALLIFLNRFFRNLGITVRDQFIDHGILGADSAIINSQPELTENLENLNTETVIAIWLLQLRLFNVPIDVAITDQLVRGSTRAEVRAQALASSTTITETTKRQIRAVAQSGVEVGKTRPEIGGDLKDHLQGNKTSARSGATAVTETGFASRIGQTGAVASSPVHNLKQWFNVGDSHVRDNHVDASLQGIIGVDEKFTVGGDKMDGPHDPTASIENLAHCRCSLKFLKSTDV